MGLVDQFAIVGSLRHFADGQDIVASGAQSTHDGEITTLVSQEPQGRRRHSTWLLLLSWF
jgi:hypothetical protein